MQNIPVRVRVRRRDGSNWHYMVYMGYGGFPTHIIVNQSLVAHIAFAQIVCNQDIHLGDLLENLQRHTSQIWKQINESFTDHNGIIHT